MINTFTEYAGFGRRLAASFLDLLWMGTIVAVLIYLSYGDDYLEYLKNISDTPHGWEQLRWQDFAISDGLPALLTIFCWLKYGATPGKLLFDCDIIDARSGKRLTFGQALLRYISYLLSALPLGLGFLWILWDKRKQGWHDKIAGTVVVIHDESTVPLSQLERG
jgi:uncharacterized RDD family membrane protein YckC